MAICNAFGSRTEPSRRKALCQNASRLAAVSESPLANKTTSCPSATSSSFNTKLRAPCLHKAWEEWPQSKELFARSACNNPLWESLPAPAPNRTSATWQLCSARMTVAEARSVSSRVLDQHVPRLKQELEVHDGLHRSPLVPRCLKTL